MNVVLAFIVVWVDVYLPIAMVQGALLVKCAKIVNALRTHVQMYNVDQMKDVLKGSVLWIVMPHDVLMELLVETVNVWMTLAYV